MSINSYVMTNYAKNYANKIYQAYLMILLLTGVIEATLPK